jgi:hypothetical protein
MVVRIRKLISSSILRFELEDFFAMKLKYKAFAFILLLAAVSFGCDPRENVLEYQSGVWNVTSLKTAQFESGVLISEETRTDSLGQMEFRPTGQGFRTDFAANRDTFTWELHPKLERLVIYYRIGQFANASIVDRSDDAMTLFWVNSAGGGANQLVTESTSTIERVK